MLCFNSFAFMQEWLVYMLVICLLLQFILTEEFDMIKDNETISEMLKQCRYTQWTITSVNEKKVKKEENKKGKVHVGEKERSRGE